MKQNKHVLIKNIYYMLSYAFRSLTQSNFDEIRVEEFDNAQNLFAAILCKGISQQLKQGLYREYVNRTEDIPVLRGKIDMAGTIRHKFAHKQLLTCEYDELSENNLHNQILKTTAMLLLRSDQVRSKYKDILKKELLYFSSIDEVDPTSVPWSRIRFQRNNQTYYMLIRICQLILKGMLLTTEKGDYKLASFVDDQEMYHLYEKFILEYYDQEFPQLSVAASQIPWALDDGNKTMLPVMQSDITLSCQNTVLIIDTKYYARTTQTHYDISTLRSSHLYQVFAYVKNLEEGFGDKPHTVSGMLLYARTDEGITPNQTYHMSGNRIDVRTLDLSRDFSLIAGQLNEIAQEFFGIYKKSRANDRRKYRCAEDPEPLSVPASLLIRQER